MAAFALKPGIVTGKALDELFAYCKEAGCALPAVNGTLLGHTRREIDERLPEIIEFAELGAFIDSPLRTYSSGMIARLGFAVATTWKPEILILDEVLSVGDEAFRHKCQIRMEQFRDQGTTTLLVTHDSNTVETLCSRAVWLDHGQVQAIGPSREIVDMYRQTQQ